MSMHERELWLLLTVFTVSVHIAAHIHFQNQGQQQKGILCEIIGGGITSLPNTHQPLKIPINFNLKYFPVCKGNNIYKHDWIIMLSFSLLSIFHFSFALRPITGYAVQIINGWIQIVIDSRLKEHLLHLTLKILISLINGGF